MFADPTPTSDAVRRRGEEKGIKHLLAAPCDLTWSHFTTVMAVPPGVTARKHGKTVYNSIFRFDDVLPANSHTFSAAASQSSIVDVQRIVGGRLFTTYMQSFERTWDRAVEVSKPAVAKCRCVARIDYIENPNVPKANCGVPSVVAVVEDDHGRILLIHKTDNDLCALPGGGHDIGESIADTVIREVKEDAGYDVEVTGIVGTCTNPRHVMAYDDGEVRQQFSICFTARLLDGELRTSSESKEVA